MIFPRNILIEDSVVIYRVIYRQSELSPINKKNYFILELNFSFVYNTANNNIYLIYRVIYQV